MPKHMLIDASHPEETRVVVLDGQRVEEFDFESASKRPLKGNIYLAKVTRVEPSLQAAFVEYGGNRQGFLAFSEIHPDYYQIPVADRIALLAEQEAEARRHAEEEFEAVETGTAVEDSETEETSSEEFQAEADDSEHQEAEPELEHPHTDDGEQDESTALNDEQVEHIAEEEVEEGIVDQQTAAAAEIVEEGSETHTHEGALDALTSEEMAEDIADTQSAAEAEIVPQPEEAPQDAASQPHAQALHNGRPPQRWMRRRHYKIQEVIKRRQIILVQVVKEERGNKGAALTTYLSLAGRYCVLMPNTPRGGGISRKITSATDRKRLKSAAAALELPEGMGLIIRTAGENRSKIEIKRDYEYLLRMWDTIRELTLKSNAPACVYEEGDLIKRAIRDLYNKEVSDVVVEGDDGYRNAKDFMRMLMPSHAKNVKPYKEGIPLFQRHRIEAQLDAMFTPTVNLKSGGYLVINQTEALVAIDVNSGRATREHSIEETATKTNLEAADEVGRQLRLRDLAGLIVIDFIDMEDGHNDRAVEKRLHHAVRHDRARIQIGKISQFGLLEMSRQRLRAGVVAGSTVPCPHCDGQGIVRSVESSALRLLRALEEEGQKQSAASVSVKAPSEVAIYTLNQKRRELARIETDYGMAVAFEPDADITAGNFEIVRMAEKPPEDRRQIDMAPPVTDDGDAAEEDVTSEEESEEEEVASESSSADSEEQSPDGGGRKRRRRRRRGGRDRNHPETMQESVPHHSDAVAEDGAVIEGQEAASTQEPWSETNGTEPAAEGQPGENGHRRRRRRRRGRRGRRDGETIQSASPVEGDGVRVDAAVQEEREMTVPGGDEEAADNHGPNSPAAPSWSLSETRAMPSKPVNAPPAVAREPSAATPTATDAAEGALPTEDGPAEEDAKPAGPARKGWWQRTFRSE